MLIFTILFDLKTQSTDFSNAFAQAEMPDDLNIYLEMPERTLGVVTDRIQYSNWRNHYTVAQ